MAVTLTSTLREEYGRLFDSCHILPQNQAEVDRAATRIAGNRDRYSDLGTRLQVPWYVIGVIHCRESSLNFNCHLHNGDPLTARTVQVPAGRPRTGSPPFTWEVSAEDALRIEKLDKWTDWTIPGTLYSLEGYNGFGYRVHHPEVKSPDVWSFSCVYTAGMYVADGTWSPTAKSKQCGAAVLLRRLAEIGAIHFDAAGVPRTGLEPADPTAGELEPLVRYSETDVSEAARKLQQALNKFPGVFLRVDGVPGQRTSDACSRVLGHFLAGDPRNTSTPGSTAAGAR
jgi:lysozyme family protein